MNAILTIILIGAVQGFLLAVIFFFQRKIPFNRLFALILILISGGLFLAYLQNVIEIQTFPGFSKLSYPLPLVFIPLLLIYLENLTGNRPELRYKNYSYFIPGLLFIMYNLPFYFGGNEAKVEYFLRTEKGNFLFSELLEEVFVAGFVLLFSVMAIKESNRYRQKTKQVYSDLARGKSRWIRFIALVMFSLSLFAFLLAVAVILFENVPTELNFITAIGSTFVVYFIAYYLLYKPEFFTGVSMAFKNIDKVIPNPEHSTDNKDISTSSSELSQRILQCLKLNKLYLNPDLTLDELAQKSGMPSYLVSKVINQNLQSTFYSLVNRYRLEEVKRKLLEKEKDGKTIIEIAYEAGFNSKTSFYEVFKKDTGVSPSTFIKINSSDQPAV